MFYIVDATNSPAALLRDVDRVPPYIFVNQQPDQQFERVA